mgnify:CR=1 FL=1
MRTEITAGQTSDYLGFDLVMADNLPEPSVLLADRGYDSDNIRKTMEVRDVVPVIPMRKTGSYGSPFTAGSTACAISLSGASTSSRMPVASPPATTRPPKASWASSTSARSVSGSAICQHNLA